MEEAGDVLFAVRMTSRAVQQLVVQSTLHHPLDEQKMDSYYVY